MAQDHFQTPPDPNMGYKNPKMNPKTRTSLIKGFHKRLPKSMSAMGHGSSRDLRARQLVGLPSLPKEN